MCVWVLDRVTKIYWWLEHDTIEIGTFSILEDSRRHIFQKRIRTYALKLLLENFSSRSAGHVYTVMHE